MTDFSSTKKEKKDKKKKKKKKKTKDGFEFSVTIEYSSEDQSNYSQGSGTYRNGGFGSSQPYGGFDSNNQQDIYNNDNNEVG